MEALHKVFVSLGICGDPLPAETIEKLVAPKEIKAMLSLSRDWHSETNHGGVCGVNMFQDDSVWLHKGSIFGGAEGTLEWCEENGEVNCAQSGWKCFGAVSEYDYIFVCVAPGDRFGATRRVVNNCWEDMFLTPAPFTCFLNGLSQYIALCKDLEHDPEHDCEYYDKPWFFDCF